MVLALATGGSPDRYATINGVRYPVLLREGGAVPVQTAPLAPFPEPLVLGDSSRSSDQRMATYALGDWRDGAGVFRYPAGQSSESLATFAVSDCDTRFERSLVCRRLPTALSGTLTGFNTFQRVLYGGYGVDRLYSFALNATLNTISSGSWSAVSVASGPFTGTAANCMGVARAGRATFAASDNFIHYTTDGSTWASSNNPGTAATPLFGPEIHDGKLWVVNRAVNNICTLYYSTDALSTPATMTWTAATGTFVVDASGGEGIVKLFRWRDRYGARCLYALTNWRLLGYDADGQAWQEVFDFRDRNVPTNFCDAYVWSRDDNLYLAVNDQGIFQLTGTAVDFIGPNIKGGIPNGQRATIRVLAGNSRYLFAFGPPPSGDGGKGGAWCLNGQGGWHRLYNDAATNVAGGGWGNGKLYTVVGSTVYSQLEPDVSDIPLNAYSGAYTYDTTVTQSHYTAIMDGGMPNIPIQPLYVEIRAIKSSDGRSQGLATNTTCNVFIRTNTNQGAGGAPTWLQVGTLTSASTFPARLPLNSGLGYLCSDIDIRLDLATSSSSATPIITDVILHLVRSAQVRSEYTLMLDLRQDNPVFRQDGAGLPGPYVTKTARDLKALLYAVSGLSATNNYRAQIVPFSYGGGPALGGTGSAPTGGSSNLVSLTAALVRVASSEDPLLGDGVFRVAVLDLTTPASGT